MTDDKSKIILKKLQEIAREPGFIYILSQLVRNDMFFAPDEAADVNWRERITNNELTLLTAYLVKDDIDLKIVPSNDEIKNIIENIRKLLDDLHKAQAKKFFDKFPTDFDEINKMSDEDKEKIRKEIFGKGENMVEPMFYGDSGAYDFQYLWLVEDLYIEDTNWLNDNNKNLGLYVTYCKALKDMVMLKATITPIDIKEPDVFMNIFTFNAETLCSFTKKVNKHSNDNISIESAQEFINTFSISAGSANAEYERPGNRNDIEAYPIIKLSDDLYYLNNEFNLAESIYNMPWIWMLHDKKYRSIADKNRGINVEKLSHKLLKRSFGDNAYRSVKVKKNNQILTDIDGLAVIGNKAIVFQEKSKWLTDLAKSGNEDSLANDFKKAIQDAYNQGLVSRNALLNQADIIFELEDGTIITPSETIDEVYIVCVTTSVYPAQISQVNNYLVKGDNDPFTISISLLDLDLMTYYLKDPYEFLYYIKQRIDLHEVISAEGEMAFLGFHLKHRIYKINENEMLVIDQTFGQLIDADLLYRMGRADKPKKQDELTPKSNNKLFEKILNELKDINEPRITDVIIYLMSLSKETIDEFMRLIQIRIDKVLEGTHGVEDFSATIDHGMGGLTYVVASSEDKMAKYMNLLAQKNKYLLKQDLWIAIGTNTNSKRLISGVQYLGYKWEHDENMEYVLKTLKKTAAPLVNKNNHKPQKTSKRKKKDKRKKRQSKRKNKK